MTHWFETLEQHAKKPRAVLPPELRARSDAIANERQKKIDRLAEIERNMCGSTPGKEYVAAQLESRNIRKELQDSEKAVADIHSMIRGATETPPIHLDLQRIRSLINHRREKGEPSCL